MEINFCITRLNLPLVCNSQTHSADSADRGPELRAGSEQSYLFTLPQELLLTTLLFVREAVKDGLVSYNDLSCP